MIFGLVPAEPQAIARALIDGIRQGNVGQSTPGWTLAVKRVLRELGRSKGYDVYMALRDPGDICHEYLLDAMWVGKDLGVHLAVECEWAGKGHVLEDFWKLLCVKAPLKVMIFFADKQPFLSRIEEYFSGYCHHVAGEKYLLIEFRPDADDRAYVYEVPSDGNVESPRFTQIDLAEAAAAA